MSWPHSGFHVHVSEPFDMTDREQVVRRLAYAYRVPVSSSQITYDGEAVRLRTRKGRELSFDPLSFLARWTLHISDRYRHMRRYAGLYAAAARRFLKLDARSGRRAVREASPVKLTWAKLIARIFGELPTRCPGCGEEMELAGFELRLSVIRGWIPDLARAPPPVRVIPYRERHRGQPVFISMEERSFEGDSSESQLRETTDDEFDQRISW